MKDKESRKLQHKRNRNSFRKTIKKRLFSNFGNLTQKRSEEVGEENKKKKKNERVSVFLYG